MRNIRLKLFVSVMLVFAILLLVTACKEKPSEPAETPQQPELPPPGSMQIDLSAFGKGDGNLLGKANFQSQQNFGMAVVATVFFNTWVVVGLAVPAGIFARALQETPTLGKDGHFHWQYTALVHEADLAGWVDIPKKQTVWEMYVTQGQKYDHFLWYTGRANLDATAGYWLFYNPNKPTTSEEMIRIDWINNSDTDRILTFTNVVPGDAHNGDQLKYTVDGTDRKIEFYNAVEQTNLIIFWDAETTAGYIQAPNYNNGQPAYWDENHNDMP